MTARELCVVTGASGFIASHVCRALNKGGYRVRGTVRSAHGEKAKHLGEVCPGIELVQADLLQSDAKAWMRAVEGARYVLHIASPFRPTGSDAEFVPPAVEGTKAVLAACLATPSVKRVVVTSSIAAVSAGYDEHGRTFTPEDWSDAEKAESYAKSKTLAERAARDLVAGQPAGRGLELVTINPGFVLGASLSARTDYTSGETMVKLVNGSAPAAPALALNVVHVDDVSEAHVAALTKGRNGGRYICWAGNVWLYEAAAALRADAEVRRLGGRVPLFRAPDWLVHVMAFMGDKTAAFLASKLNFETFYDTSATTKELGIAFKPAMEAVLDAARDALAKGWHR